MTRNFFSKTFAAACLCIPALASGVAIASDEDTARELTVLLKSSRAVLVQNKPLIFDPQGAGISADKFLELAYANYESATGNAFAIGDGDKGAAQEMLVAAIKGTVADVVSGADIELSDDGRFLPAIFARKAATRFSEGSGGKMYLKLTTQDKYLVNEANKADDWERGVIEGKFVSDDWPKGETFAEMAEHDGKSAYRLILPEYYKEGCMGCHGGAAGEAIHAGKVEGNLGDVGGAISVAIYK